MDHRVIGKAWRKEYMNDADLDGVSSNGLGKVKLKSLRKDSPF